MFIEETAAKVSKSKVRGNIIQSFFESALSNASIPNWPFGIFFRFGWSGIFAVIYSILLRSWANCMDNR